MKPIILIMMFLTCGLPLRAQSFDQKFSLAFPPSIVSAEAAWGDMDNDGLPDMVFMVEDNAGASSLRFIKGDTVNAAAWHATVVPLIDATHYWIADYDRDNALDVIVTGTKNGSPATVVYRNEENIVFSEIDVPLPQLSASVFADLNNDARPEWIVSGEKNGRGFVLILKETAPGTWAPLQDTLAVNAPTLEVTDINNDGRHDVFVSGTTRTGTYHTGFLINRGDTLEAEPGNAWRGRASRADVNADGIFEVIFSGVNAAAQPVHKVYQRQGGTTVIQDFAGTLASFKVFAADLNADGLADRSFFGTTAAGDTLHVVQYEASTTETLSSARVLDVVFGDREHDGDLDLLQIKRSNGLQAVMLENAPAEKNRAPLAPPRALALSVYNRTFVYWEKSTDDHTPVVSLTYDVFFHRQGLAMQTGWYDLLNERRLGPAHGNNGTHNFKLLKRVPTSDFSYIVQSVDHALYGGVSGAGGGGVCMGSGVTACLDQQKEIISVCSDESVVLTAPDDALWFSFAGGFMGSADSVALQPGLADTVFSFTPSRGGCDALRLYEIYLHDDTVKETTATRYACVGEVIPFSVEPGWDQIQWTSLLRGNLGTATSLTYTFQQPDSVFVTLSNTEGCTLLRKTALLLSKPEVTVEADRYKVLKGSEVQLHAAGASRYTWTPPNGLSRTDIADPVAIPMATLQYTVTGYDSLGCSDQATVTIVVEGTGFIPNLFTPNADGTNDQLKIYGLASASDFTFSIVNREGSVVYKTSSVADAVQNGWDGTSRGIQQPSGVYFWKVKGSMGSGDKVLLNGKTSGSIVLVR